MSMSFKGTGSSSVISCATIIIPAQVPQIALP